MGGISIWQLLIVAALVLVLFGRGKISELMGDVGKGINSFKKGLKQEAEAEAAGDTKTERVAETADEAIDITPTKEKQDA